MATGVLKRRADQLEDSYNELTYEEYVSKINDKLKEEMREMKESLEQQKRQKERLAERMATVMELRVREKRENEISVTQLKIELDKVKKERQQMENQLKNKGNELQKLKTALTVGIAKDDIECDKCEFKTRSEVSLILHTINHKLSHSNQRRLILHPNVFNSRNPNSSYLYMCPLCDGTALTRNEIYPHIYLKHTKEKAYKCNECDIFFTHIDFLITHNKHEHKKNTTNTVNIGFEIPREPLITSIYKPTSNRGTQTMTMSANGNLTNSGDLSTTGVSTAGCSYVYTSQVGGEDVMKCSFSYCSFTTNNRQKLEFHISAHTNSKYKCPFCAYVGNILTDIYRHVKKSTKHVGKKVFECKKCSYGIDCEKTFKEHLRADHFSTNAPDKDIDAHIEDMFLNKPSTG